MGAEPMQVFCFKDGKDIQFDESGLERLLLADHVKDKPVAVVSVAGGYRQGKSFLLSFFLRYLRNNGRPDWMEDIDTPLEGFEWRPGSTRQTTGILLWNEVFLVKNSDGEEVAVLLMDTQGTFDCVATMKESTAIFSLSMMISTVQIYNIMNNIKEDDLQHLQFFAEYGILAQKETESAPFQKLLFLIRDWRWPKEKPFGFDGGKKLLASHLEVRDSQATELKQLRERILSSFKDIECFLMPYPGEKVASDDAFDGRLEDIKELFREKLSELVQATLAPDSILAKEVNGRRLTCQELMIFFKAYVDVFKTGHLPEPTSMLLATANASNVAAMGKARRYYMSEMKKRPHGNLAKLRELHEKLLEKARKIFEDFPTVGGDTIASTSMDALTKELDELFYDIFSAEEEFIKKEQQEEARRQRERYEEQKRREKMEKEQAQEREQAAAEMERINKQRAQEREKAERELQRMRKQREEERQNDAKEKEEMIQKVTSMQSQIEDLDTKLKASQGSPFLKVVKGIGLSLVTPLVAIASPSQLPDHVEEISRSFAG